MLINHEIESWLSQARESMNQLMHVYRDLPKSLITDEDQEESSNGTYDYDSEAEQDDVVVQDQDGHFFINPAPSADSGLTDGSPVPSGHRQRKKDSQAGGEAAGLPSSAVPFGLMANVAKEMSRLRVDDQETSGNDAIGVASNTFFKSASSLGWEAPAKPAILTSQIVSPVEAEKLFRIYFDKMNLSLSTLDPVLYTAAKTCYRSPFLFTVICAIASRFYTERPELYHELMNHARSLAGQALIKGPKTVDMCHAFILLALYPVPGKRLEDDNSWIYLGMAIRVAIDLNLQYPPSHEPADEMRARELLNRTRVWINCYNLDRSTGSQYGRPPVINQMDYVANHSEDWWRSSQYNLTSFDIHLCAYNADLRIMSEFRAKIYSNPNHPTLLNKDVDLESLATETDEKLKKVGDIWLARLEQGDMGNPQHCFRTDLIRLAYSYARLAVLSYGFQHAFGKSDSDENPFLLRCLTAAMDVVRVFTKEVGRPEQRVFVRHGPEAQSVFVTFASAFLIKLLQPKFASYLSVGQRSTIIRSVQSVVELLGSSEIALDDRHSPKLYSSFLQGLLGKVDRAESRRHQKKASSSTAAASSSSRRTPSKDFSQATEHEATASNHSSPGSEPLVPPANSAPLSGSLDQFAPPSAINDVFMFDFDFPVPTPMSDQGFFYPQLPFDEAIKENARMLGLSSDFFAQSNFANGANGDCK
ncbi:hypothetical protein FISHEDRAFT_52517 [Fistulina hepatica ATCC 64428]|nr:hypothetical protein FISHEDRAFT_52517 [Fistulina hepatica ATCC 64428]